MPGLYCSYDNVAFFAVAKFKKRSQFLEYFVVILNRALNEGLHTSMIDWAKDALVWLTRQASCRINVFTLLLVLYFNCKIFQYASIYFKLQLYYILASFYFSIIFQYSFIYLSYFSKLSLLYYNLAHFDIDCTFIQYALLRYSKAVVFFYGI